MEAQVKDEKAYTYELFIKEEVQKSCGRAIVRYETITDQMKVPSSKSQLDHIKLGSAQRQQEKNEQYRERYQDLVQQL